MLKVINPANQKILAELQEDTQDTIVQKYKGAKSAQKKWANLPLEERTATIRKARDLFVERKAKLAAITTSEVGKPLTQSHNELTGLITRIDFFLENTATTLNIQTVFHDPSQKMKEQIELEPLGVIANISAWNYPYFVGSNVFIPALLTGNAVLYKPSEFSTLTGLAIAEILHEAGVPKDVFIPIVGAGQTGSWLLDQPVQGVFFTGSYPTGRKIAEKVAGRLIKIQLELGGKDPVYVADDVDVNAVAEGIADGAFYNTGQSCCSVERIYAHAKIYDRFIEAFTNTVRSFKMGDPTEDGVYIGPLTREAQISVLERQVEDAVKKGGALLVGGRRSPLGRNYFEPTVIAHASHSMELMREESFGPVIGIQKVENDQQAIDLMNDTAYGLTAGVYTRNEARARKILSYINSGSVYWNCCDRVSPRLPWSGRGHSGIGATLSRYGIETFTQPKAWHLRSV